MKPTDLPLLVGVSKPTAHPSGAFAVVALTHPDLGSDATVGQLWRVDLTDGSKRMLTRGFRDTAPRFSPDGSLLAFVRAGRTTPGQLHVMRLDGGEPVALTDAPLGVGDFAWSPDGASLVFAAREPEPGRYGTVDGLDAAAEPPRRITTRKYRANGLGYTGDRPAHLFRVEVPDLDAEPVYERAPSIDDRPEAPPTVPAAHALYAGPADVRSPEVSADGEWVYLVGALHGERDLDLRSDVYRIPLRTEGGGADAAAADPERVTDHTGSVDAFALGGHGRVWVIASDVGESGRDFVGRPSALHVVEAGVTRRLTDPESVDLGEDGSRVRVLDDDHVLVQDRTRGRLELLRVGVDGTAEQLTDGEVLVTGVDVAAGAAVLTIQTPDSPGELAVLRTASGTPWRLDAAHDAEDVPRLHVLTDLALPLRAAGFVEPYELTVPARDGGEVHGWVAVPPGEGPHPVLLNIHGGPFTQYGVGFFDETQVYTGAGYAVVYCNPRGSAGYGQEHGRAIRHRMGTVDLTDVLDFLDGAVAAHPGLDGERVGILGGSYGGYLTAWTIAHDHRFAAAIVERGFVDPVAFEGTSDIGSFFGGEYTGTDPGQVAAQSPQAVVGQVRTATLVLHSEQDLRCPLSQAEQYYAALQRHGVETELLVFPGENHELSRSGRPRHRVQRFEAILDWWDRYLPVGRRAEEVR